MTEKLFITFIPSLVSVLWAHEKEKGSPLTEQEVLDIRNKATAVALPPESAVAVEESRGYHDIDADNCWEEWQRARVELIEYDRSSRDSD